MCKGDVTRERIVAEAAPLFNQRGYAGCSMQDVMDATGLEKGGIYRHFSCKEELAAEAFRYSSRKAMAARSVEGTSVQGAIPALLQKVHQFVRIPSPIAGGCPLMNTAIDADDTNPLLRALAKDAIRDWKARLGSIVEDGIRTGEIRADVHAMQIANAIVATLEGSLMISRLEGTRQAMLDAEHTLEVLIDGLANNRSAGKDAARRHQVESTAALKKRAPIRAAKQRLPVVNS